MDKKESQLKTIKIIQDSKYKTLTFTAFSVVLVVILIVGAITPSVSKMIAVRTEISSQKLLDEQLTAKVNNLGELSQEYDELDYVIKDLPLIFPNNGDFSAMMANIEKVCINNGFEMASISFDAGDSALYQNITGSRTLGVLQPRVFSLSVRGKPSNITKLLRSIEKLPMYPEIVSYSYGNVVDDKGNGTYTVMFTMYVIDNNLFY